MSRKNKEAGMSDCSQAFDQPDAAAINIMTQSAHAALLP